MPVSLAVLGLRSVPVSAPSMSAPMENQMFIIVCIRTYFADDMYCSIPFQKKLAGHYIIQIFIIVKLIEKILPTNHENVDGIVDVVDVKQIG